MTCQRVVPNNRVERIFFVPQLIRKVIIKILRFYEVMKIIICVAKFTKILLASTPSVRVLPNKSVLSGIF